MTIKKLLNVNVQQMRSYSPQNQPVTNYSHNVPTINDMVIQPLSYYSQPNADNVIIIKDTNQDFYKRLKIVRIIFGLSLLLIIGIIVFLICIFYSF